MSMRRGHHRCRICRQHRRIKAVKRRGGVNEMRALIEELHNETGEAEEDVAYHRAILDGSWPSSVEILERALERARLQRKATA